MFDKDVINIARARQRALDRRVSERGHWRGYDLLRPFRIGGGGATTPIKRPLEFIFEKKKAKTINEGDREVVSRTSNLLAYSPRSCLYIAAGIGSAARRCSTPKMMTGSPQCNKGLRLTGNLVSYRLRAHTAQAEA